MTGTITIEGDNLIFEMRWVDRILGLKRSITIPLRHVVSVSTEKVSWFPTSQTRLPGTNVPYIVKDGSYTSPEGWIFYEMHDPNKCVTITLRDEEYKRIVFEVEDKESSAAMIEAAIDYTPHSEVTETSMEHST